jgi:hypothetical protein
LNIPHSSSTSNSNTNKTSQSPTINQSINPSIHQHEVHPRPSSSRSQRARSVHCRCPIANPNCRADMSLQVHARRHRLPGRLRRRP